MTSLQHRKLQFWKPQLWITLTNFQKILKLKSFSLQTLGVAGCSLIPFAQVVAASTGSLSLVAIALDRYLAVLNKSNAKVLRSKVFCCSVLASLWVLCFGISSPILISYDHIQTYVVPEERQEEFYLSYLCIADIVSE